MKIGVFSQDNINFVTLKIGKNFENSQKMKIAVFSQDNLNFVTQNQGGPT